MKNWPTTQQIAEHLKTAYGIHIETLNALALGADVNATVYKAVSKNKPYFIKLKQGHQHDVSFMVIGLLLDSGVQQIISPIKTIQGDITSLAEDCTLIAYPYIEGHNGFSKSLTEAQWKALGKTLKQVHEIQVPASIQALMRHEDYTPQWREAVRSVMAKLDDIVSVDAPAQALIAFMKRKVEIIHQLVDSAAQLALKVQGSSTKNVLCHADIHAGNVLIDEENRIYIIDWDAPMMAPKERDLMFIGGGVGNVWNKPNETALFYQGYGQTEANSELLAFYRLERIVVDIAEFSQALLLSPAGSEQERAVSLQHFIDMFASNGVAEIAMREKHEMP